MAICPPRDAEDVLTRMARIGAIKETEGVAAMVSAFLAEESIWGKNLASDDLVTAVTEAYQFLTVKPLSLNMLDQWIER